MVMYGYTMSITIHNHFCCTICFEEKRMKNPKDRIREIENRLEQLPKGTLTYKTINGKKQPYVQRSLDGLSFLFPDTKNYILLVVSLYCKGIDGTDAFCCKK